MAMQSNKYQVVLLKRATQQFDKAIDWYKSKNLVAKIGFIKDVDERLIMLQNYPFRYRKTYKQFHEISLLKSPYILIYKIDDDTKQVLIASVHHHKQNPKRKYRQ